MLLFCLKYGKFHAREKAEKGTSVNYVSSLNRVDASR